MGQFIKGRTGFQIDFKNGWSVSVQFGAGHYCANGKASINISDEFLECPNAEIAAWPTDARGEGYSHLQEWFTFEDGDQVKGWQSPEQVLQFMNMISTLNAVEPDWLSNCCDVAPSGELDSGDTYRLGFCSRCHDKAVFTKEYQL